MFQTEKVDGEDYPIGIFKFKYRSNSKPMSPNSRETSADYLAHWP